MPLHRARAEEEPDADVRIREALAGQTRDLPLLGGENVAGLDGPLAHVLAGRKQLTPGPLGECLHPDRRELVVGGTELDTRVAAAILAAQPLPVEQLSPGELGTQAGAAQPLDRLAIQALGTRALAQERPAARLDSQAPVGLAGRGGHDHTLERTGRDLRPGAANRRFD